MSYMDEGRKALKYFRLPKFAAGQLYCAYRLVGGESHSSKSARKWSGPSGRGSWKLYPRIKRDVKRMRISILPVTCISLTRPVAQKIGRARNIVNVKDSRI